MGTKTATTQRLDLNLGSLNKKISPTYLSSDLHSPNQKRRMTIPSLGRQRTELRPLGGKSWGESKTSYGGIGNLPFLGKKRGRDLFVPQNQKHFSSGLSKYETDVQPYMLTAFKYSGCRENDQVLPPCFKIGLNPYEMVVFDGSPIIPYFSHKPKHEVLPRHDPDRKMEGSAEDVLTERTRKALHDYYTYLYETNFYSTTYPNHMAKDQSQSTELPHLKTKETVSCAKECNINQPFIRVNEQNSCYSKIIPLLAKLCLLSNKSDVTPLKGLLYSYVDDLMTCFSMEAYEEFYNVIKALAMFSESSSAKELGINLQDFHLNILIDILDGNATSQEKVLKLRKVISQVAESSDSVSLSKPPQEFIQQERKSHVTKQTDQQNQVPGVSPCWPPSTSYMLDLRTLQLKSTGSLPQGESNSYKITYPDRKQNLPGQLPKLKKPKLLHSRIDLEPYCVVQEESLNGPGLPEYKKFINSILPVHFDERGEIFDELPDVPEIFPVPKAENDKEKYAAMDKLGRKAYLPPISLSDCLPADGDRIQDRLGLHFKSEAHKRFHAMYPDSVPDLRDNFSYRKRYFFNGYHASAFR